MKKSIIVLSILLGINKLYAQELDATMLTKKWKFDLELMRSVLEKRLLNNPDMANLDSQNKEVAIQTALEKIATNEIEYKTDSKMITTTSKGKTEGTWKLDEKNKTLITYSGDSKKEKKYEIISLSAKKLHLKTDNTIELIFISQD